MKNTMTKLVLFALAVVFAASPAFGQSTPIITTLSAAVSGGSNNTTFTVASTTGMTGTSTSPNMFCVVNHEQVQIRSVTNSTTFQAIRSQGTAIPHKSGEFLICGPPGTFNPTTGNTNGLIMGGTFAPSGACTAANNQYLPVVYTGGPASSWALYNCNNGSWVPQTFPDDVGPGITRFCMPAFPGSLTLLTSFGDANSPINMGTNTTPTAARWYYGTIEIPRTTLLTGISQLNGLVVGTDTILSALARADGTVVANTATAGTTTANAGRFQDVPFTSTYLATGPARYWLASQVSGTTTRLSTISVTPAGSTAGAGAWIGMLGSFFLGTTGTVPTSLASIANTPTWTVTALPTTLIDDAAVVSCAY